MRPTEVIFTETPMRADVPEAELQSWLAQRIDRWRRFLAGTLDGPLVIASCDDPPGVSSPWDELSEYRFPDDALAFTERLVAWQRVRADLARDIGDDTVPSIGPAIGIALNSSWLTDQPMQAAAGTTWSHPVIHEWGDLDRLHPDTEGRFVRMMRQMLDRITAGADGAFCTHSFSHFGPSDLANAIRGDSLFTDFYESPDEVHRLMRVVTDATIWLEQVLRRHTPTYAGGTPIWGAWLPGDAVFMSEDASDLCGPSIYDEFFGPYTRRVADQLGGCYIHHHARGYQVHERIAELVRPVLLQISRDPNCEPPARRAGQLQQQTGPTPLIIQIDLEDLDQLLDCDADLSRMVVMLSTATREEARAAIARLRSGATH